MSNKPVLSAAAEDMDRKVNEATGDDAYGVFIDFLIAFLPTLVSLLGMCKDPIPPAPEPVTPPADETEASAWQKAWTMKYRSTDGFNEDTQDYDAHLLRSVAKKARREKRRDGQRINAREAIEIARQFLDKGRTDSMETIAAGIMESQS